MAIFKLPKWVMHRIKKLRRAFLWKGRDTVGGFRWDRFCRLKDLGGLRIKKTGTNESSITSKMGLKYLNGSDSILVE